MVNQWLTRSFSHKKQAKKNRYSLEESTYWGENEKS